MGTLTDLTTRLETLSSSSSVGQSAPRSADPRPHPDSCGTLTARQDEKLNAIERRVDRLEQASAGRYQ
jgi:hypothetical protein